MNFFSEEDIHEQCEDQTTLHGKVYRHLRWLISVDI